ncbi:19891_t:CDS:1 [Racocetra persica]|uniref:19891_t:CDS:1 n=1 Tax=Racocetra persica TaxID=160502 RepID=A0ACA9LCX8_9GLOM|nr:19891_t:CDS:1 [Racocetra persica]
MIVIPFQFAFRPNFQEYMAEFIGIGSELVSKVRPIRQINYINTENEEDGVVQVFLSVPHKYFFAYLFKISSFLAVALCVAAYSWYVAINYTTMANLTAIYNTSCFWAYIFSVFLLGESIKIEKVGSVFLSIAGVIIMTMNQKDQTPGWGDSEIGGNGIIFTGDLIALFGAVTYGLYEVLYKKYGSPPIPSIAFSNTITGLIGVFTLIFLWVPIPILHYMGIEEFCLPDMKTFGYILFMASFGVIFNACFMLVIALTSPVFASVGLMLTIPIVAFVDALVIKSPLSANTIVGGLCILISFVLLSWKSIINEIERRRSD